MRNLCSSLLHNCLDPIFAFCSSSSGSAKNKIVAEYALGDRSQPMGVAKVKLLESLPAEFQTSLPSIEQIESELGGIDV